jgi:hypothetical protein
VSCIFDSLSGPCGALRAEKLRAHGIPVNSGSDAQDAISQPSSPRQSLIDGKLCVAAKSTRTSFFRFPSNARVRFLVKKIFYRGEK